VKISRNHGTSCPRPKYDRNRETQFERIFPAAALPFPNTDPVIIHIGPQAVHWYGVGYIVGILFAWWYAKRLVTTQRLYRLGGHRRGGRRAHRL